MPNDDRKEASTPPILLVDDPHAPEFFASALTGAGFDGPNIRMTFESARHSHEADPARTAINRVVNVRVVMSIPQAIQMVGFLQNFLANATLNQTQKPPDQPMQ